MTSARLEKILKNQGLGNKDKIKAMFKVSANRN